MADTPEETVAEPVTPFEMAKALRVDADRRLDCGLPLAASMLRLAADALDRQAAEITALRAEIEALRGTWRPIAEAPDGIAPMQRWHKAWKCVVAVSRNAGRISGVREWITATRDQSWPEEAFTPHWMPVPEGPPAEPDAPESAPPTR